MIGFFGFTPAFWTLSSAFLTGAGAAAAMGLIPVIGNLGTLSGAWNGAPIPDRPLLETRLRQIAGQSEQPEVHLRPNKLVTYDAVAMVLASAQRLGVSKIGLVGNEQFLN